MKLSLISLVRKEEIRKFGRLFLNLLNLINKSLEDIETTAII